MTVTSRQVLVVVALDNRNYRAGMKPKRDLVRVPPPPPATIQPGSATDRPQFTEQDVEDVGSTLEHARADNTDLALASDWRMFEKFCAERSAQTLPALPEVVVAYLTALFKGRIADKDGKLFPRKLATIKRHLSTISTRHIENSFPSPRLDPRVSITMKAIARGMPPELRQMSKQALTIDLLERVILTIPDDFRRTRDVAVLSHGFHSGGRRRSEIVGTNIEDVSVTPDVTYVMLDRSKTDQERKGSLKRIPRNGNETCPAAAIDALLADLKRHGLVSGPLYRKIANDSYLDDRMDSTEVADIVKQGVTRLGLDPRLFAGHSLRSGFITSAVKAGIGIFDIKPETGHKTTEALSIYVQSIVEDARDLPSAKIVEKFKKDYRR